MKPLSVPRIPKPHRGGGRGPASAAVGGPRQGAAARFRPRPDAAFTLKDLVALLAALVLLAGLTASSNGHPRTKSQLAICLSNLRQLTAAWQAYADADQGKLPGNLDGGSNWNRTNETWCGGWLDNSTFTPDNTNWVGMMNSQLGRYVRTPAVFKCPADTSLSRGKQGSPRVRSVSMNGYLGRRAGSYTSGYRQFALMSELTDPSPSRAFVFIDEREDSINDGCFNVDMSGYDPPAPGVWKIVDFPADWHNQAGNLSFADGHAETWRWQDRRTMPVHRFAQLIPLAVNSPGNSDVARIQAAASRRVR